MSEGKKKKKWMKKAFENSHGQFREKAERAGKSTSEFAKEHEHDSGKLGRQARLAEVGMKMSKRKKHKSMSASERRDKWYGKSKKD